MLTIAQGVGVNVAMADALSLAHELVARKDSFRAKVFTDAHNIQTAIRDYEKEMFPRAQQNAEKTYKGLEGHFSKTGGQERASKFQRGYQELLKRQQQQTEAKNAK